jgi:type II secretory pathway pseudopilin PulG
MERIHKHKAFTLVECMVMMLVLIISLVGTLGFRYHSVLNAQHAEDQLLAARAAQVISDAWRAQKGDADFDPIQQSFDTHFEIQPNNLMAFEVIGEPATVMLGRYLVDIEGRQFQAVLAYEAAMGIPNARMLHVWLTWRDSRKVKQQFNLSTLSQTNS